ncbi:MAG: LpqB family beta-propeller domain-containing protein [Pseudomonadales bacterium]|jgi:Tol biopolymer transport system component/imidazolonepropionase-like amidohydrolase|nr:LpqB family beta-propeller domain-containing protein [Pseudomonadales bacterium]
MYARAARLRIRHRPGRRSLTLFLFLALVPSSWGAFVELREGTNFSVARSPDGEKMVMALQGVLWGLDASGGDAAALTVPELDAHEPVWSPDGSLIAFYAFAENGFSVFTMEPDGSRLQRRTSQDFDARYPAWSADGRTLFYSADAEGGYALQALDLETGTVEALTDPSKTGYEMPDTPYFRGAGNAVYPTPSPDGRALAFVIDGPQDQLLVRASGGTQRMLLERDLLGAPAWTRDGSALYVVALSEGAATLLRVALADGAVTELVSGRDLFPFRPDVGADGSLVYTADGQIVHHATPEAEPRALPFSATVSLARVPYERRSYDFADPATQRARGIIDPVLSPNGDQLVYAALGDLWTADLPAGDLRRLTDDDHIDLSPAFSPDGTQLVWVSDRSGKAELWMMSLEDGHSEQLTDLPEPVNVPVFSPDGRSVAFLRDAFTSVFLGATVEVLDLGSGSMRSVSPPMFGPSAPAWSPDGSTLAVFHRAPSNSRFREGVNVVRLLDAGEKGPGRFVSPVSGESLGRRQFNRPAWSREGEFVYRFDGALWIASLDAEGSFSEARRIADVGENPSWSADGDKLVYLEGGLLRVFDRTTGQTQRLDLEPSWGQHLPDRRFTLRASDVFDGDKRWPKGDYAVRIEDGVIAAVGPFEAADASEEVIDVRGRFLMPGLIESHTHQSISQGKALGRLFLCHGITTVRETGDDPYHAVERREAQAAGRRAGPRVFTAGPLNEGARVSYGVSDTIGSLGAVAVSARLSEAMGLDLYKSYVRQDYRVQRRAIELAHLQGIPVTSHELYPAVANGIDYMEHLGATSRRGFSLKQSRLGWAYQDVIELINRSGVVVVPTIAMTERPGRDMTPAFETLRRIDAGGGHFVAGTDSPFIAHAKALQRELELYAEAGIAPTRVLRAATADAAEALGAGGMLGRIAPGHMADLLVLDADPLTDMEGIRAVDQVFQNGEPVQCTAEDVAWIPPPSAQHAH